MTPPASRPRHRTNGDVAPDEVLLRDLPALTEGIPAMHKLLVLYPEPTDRATFEDYYVNKHLPLATTLPGLSARVLAASLHCSRRAAMT